MYFHFFWRNVFSICEYALFIRYEELIEITILLQTFISVYHIAQAVTCDEATEYSCFEDRKCVPLASVKDRKNDCGDNSDEGMKI